MQRTITMVFGNSLLLLGAARASNGRLSIGRSASGSRVIYASPGRNGTSSFSVFDGDYETEISSPGWCQPGESQPVPVAINDAGTVLLARGDIDSDTYRFELVDQYGHTQCIGYHQFTGYWSRRSIRALLNDHGHAAILVTEFGDKKASTLYWSDGTRMEMVEQDVPSAAVSAGLQRFVLSASGRLEFTIVDPDSRRSQLLTRDRDGIIRAWLDQWRQQQVPASC